MRSPSPSPVATSRTAKRDRGRRRDRVSFFALSKVLTQLVYPLSIALLLLVAALVSLGRSRVRAARRFLGAAIALLCIASLPVVGYHALDGLERRFPPVQPEATPSAGAIVLLGGAIAPPYPPRHSPELKPSARPHSALL